MDALTPKNQAETPTGGIGFKNPNSGISSAYLPPKEIRWN